MRLGSCSLLTLVTGFRLIPLLGLIPVCGCDNTSLLPGQKPFTGRVLNENSFIAFIAETRNDPFWPIIRRGAEEYNNSVGALKVQYYVPEGNSPRHQLELLKTLNHPDMVGICIHMADPLAARPGLERLQSQGVRIVSMLRPAPDGIGIGHVGFDDHDIGVMLAEATARAIDDKGSIMLLHADSDDAQSAERIIGFREGIRRRPGIEVFSSENGRNNPLESRRIIRSKSERFPRLSAWVTLDDPPRQLVGEERPVPRGMRLVTFGGLPDHWPFISDGTCAAVVAANYHESGLQAAEFCDQAIREKPEQPLIHELPLRIVSLVNLDEYIRDWKFWSSGQWVEGALNQP